MSDESGLIDGINRVLSRRKALARFAQAVGALLVGIVARPQEAQACGTGCCTLCVTPAVGFNNSACDCIWGWKCPDQGGDNRTCYYYQCEECIKPLQNGCTLEKCSMWNLWNECSRCMAGAIASRYTQTTVSVPGCKQP